MKNAAFLIGISRYPDHVIKGVPNDLDLLARALQAHNYPRAAIHLFKDTHTTLAELRTLLAHIRAEYEGIHRGTCYLYLGGSGAVSLEPLRGGLLPTDGDPCDFSTVLPFDALNEALPVRPGIRVALTIDT
jgi:hypothetical protein